MEACDSDGTDGPEDHDHEHGPLNDATAAVLIASLVAANPIEYDQRRKEAAKRLRVRVETIDSEVHKARQAVISDHDVPRPPDYSEENLAQTFSARHHGQLRYVAEWGKWMIFGEGGIVEIDRVLEIVVGEINSLAEPQGGGPPVTLTLGGSVVSGTISETEPTNVVLPTPNPPATTIFAEVVAEAATVPDDL